MKSTAHAWLALMALERLKFLKNEGYVSENFKSFYLGKSFDSYYNNQAERFVKFFDKHKDAFVQGAVRVHGFRITLYLIILQEAILLKSKSLQMKKKTKKQRK